MELCDRCYEELSNPEDHGLYKCPLEPRRETRYIATDDFPGGYVVKHGLVNPDGSPRTFYSKTELKRAANEMGYTIGGDTPRPYRVHWSGRKRGSKEEE